MVSTNFKGELCLQGGFRRLPKLNAEDIASWEDQDGPDRSGIAGTVNAVGQAVASAVLPGAIGKMASAALGATVDSTIRSPHLVRIEWFDGKQSLMKMSDSLYRHFEVLLREKKVQKPSPIEEPPTPAGAAAAIPTIDVTEQLLKLAALRDQGILTEEEFSAKKSELLKRL